MTSGDVGLTILASINMIGECQWGIRQSAELENQMIAVERIIEYTKLPSEGQFGTKRVSKPTRHWPSDGRISFRSLSLRYAKDSNEVLKNLTLDINSEVRITCMNGKV